MSIGSENDFISLQEATKYCEYAQEYLSLRARQKKLGAVKLGRNWFTTIEWLQEYVDKAEGYKKKIQKKQKEEFTKGLYVRVLPDPPVNLPIEQNTKSFARVHSLPPRKLSFQESLKIGFAFAVVVFLVGVTTVLGRDTFENVSQNVYPIVEQGAQSVATSVPIFAGSKSDIFSGSAAEVSGGYVSWLWENITRVGKSFAAGVRSVHFTIAEWVRSLGERVGTRFVQDAPENPQAEQQQIVQELPQPPVSPQQGLVVVPSSDQNAEIRAQVQRSFSDEVHITPQDEETGIITPVFREKTGEDYFYILVPLQDAE